MNYSYWEIKEWFSNVDYTVVGSGIVGLNCALRLKERFPNAKVLVLEKGLLPQGASTKNAGFACFGSVSEILSDLKKHSEEEVFDLIKKRWEGLELLRKILGDSNIDYQHHKGYELFQTPEFYESCVDHIPYLNLLLQPIFKEDVFSFSENTYRFENIHPNYIVNAFEGQIDTGKMMASLLHMTQQKGISILNNCEVKEFTEGADTVTIKTNTVSFNTRKLLIATNGFSGEIIDEEVKPARAQVVVTKPIPNLHIKGTFHLDEGYYYFRNIDDRILFGGGRNLNFETEETTEFGQTELVQDKLEELLKTTILPDTTFEIEQRWSGIMGVGNQKKAIVKSLSENVFCGVRLGGMGVAIGSLVGKELADLV
ncbi:FAD-dependent oxidoreductase [Flavobacteriaceae bacterium S356]|uniref:FAD-dependent oxidoreductase n=1 Tax=Asprobacillus argus TaxID=3076534 RepID=A0ABU3LCD9_9FLAO|nr:FAD-dependent oxidoreductase [Flavobacteriaceae bacterium S356]